MADRPLTPREAAFCAEYLQDLNGAAAAARAGYSERTARQQASRLLSKANIQAEVQRLMAARAERVEASADLVLREFLAIATADPNDLVEFRRRCCRYCWGKGFRYQETPSELEARQALWAREVTRAADDKPVERFDKRGGLGWDPRKDPNPGCPECWGQGVGEAVIKDSARAPEAARKLYAGIKVTADGVQVLMNDKVGSLTQIGRHLGMFVDRKQLSGPGDGPIETVTKIERVIVRPNAKDPDS